MNLEEDVNIRRFSEPMKLEGPTKKRVIVKKVVKVSNGEQIADHNVSIDEAVEHVQEEDNDLASAIPVE